MARISGIDIPKEKRGVISLTYIYGIGISRAKMILKSECSSHSYFDHCSYLFFNQNLSTVAGEEG